METTPIIIDIDLKAPIEKIWKALTNKSDLNEWFFEVDDFELEIGSHFKFYIGGEEEKYEHICKILIIKENREFSYSWKYPDYAGTSIVTFELSKTGINKTHLSFSHACTEIFSRQKAFLSHQYYIDQWNEKINIALKEYVESRME